MSKEKETTQRRVYVLPQELVDRIVEFQTEKGYPSEVEAARKLLDEALKSRDTYETIVKRFLSRLESLKMPSEVAKDVLVGHPLVSKLSFDISSITFELKDGYKIEIYDNGHVIIWDEYSREVEWPQSSGFSRNLDDEIPF